MTEQLDPAVFPAGHEPRVGRAERWLARLSFLCALGAAAVLVVTGLTDPLALGVAVLAGAVLLAALWVLLSTRGVRRWVAGAVAVAAPVVAVLVGAALGVLWQVVAVAVLAAAGSAAARAALGRARPPDRVPERDTPPPANPFLIMNPRSGGGKVGRFRLDERAADLGARVALLDGPGEVDVAALARRAVAEGADLLGVAGGDGTQALVAGVAAEHGLPFLVISAGTRNHLAMDLGLDRERPDRGLHALDDGVELTLDLGDIGGRTFVNNASFGAYAEVVQSPAYRDDKVGTTLQLLPDLLAARRGPRLRVHVDGELTLEAPTALLVSNNPYGAGDHAGLGRRPRLDTGRLGVVAVTVWSAAQAAGLLRGRHSTGLRSLIATEVVVDADVPEIPVGVDGEALLLPTPVRCTIRPGALRVRVPRERPGVPPARPQIDRALLRRQALTVGRLARAER
ncbi:diacylglycerol/lipid kinase family protein [Geodermatophilus marinus]|uniref:diacylglycerol/lipid kinase family protein n=1 Tax=Geodermatophilus sp. LHW52908 TaxID=2303986 RepID=UPI000E3D512C|nr:diacylglycerol kinase family protein [Geodermatophilus sp. LHW52908]RFU22031.1 diacylglycerol kinase [Geodermatophilus sp. LHW52908]